ncbi:hypothetical protein A5780_37625 [Nocardia sp. 852002-20019_SCH5090214]|nr:DUF4158 domain-containing protein [Nocardia sp. 852002-20019_SCH5090214]OBA44427.1 hypothetical protein A5780_37625 [Nocardia sp. 852002-20019_SCH5090214]
MPAFIDPGRGRGPADPLGIAIALCTLPWLGFGPDRVVTAPPVAVARLAEQLKVQPTESGDPAGPVSMVERIAHARAQAQCETYDRLAHEFTPARCVELDALLVTDVSLGVTPPRWTCGERDRSRRRAQRPRCR